MLRASERAFSTIWKAERQRLNTGRPSFESFGNKDNTDCAKNVGGFNPITMNIKLISSSSKTVASFSQSTSEVVNYPSIS